MQQESESGNADRRRERREIARKIVTAIGLIMFVLGICSADSECLLIPIVLAFGGAAILYPMYRDYEESEDEAE